jgi:hypothetical protein
MQAKEGGSWPSWWIGRHPEARWLVRWKPTGEATGHPHAGASALQWKRHRSVRSLTQP